MRKIALVKDILDYPNAVHKSHSHPTPYLGGVAITLGVLIITYSALIVSGFKLNNFWLTTTLLGPAVAMGLIGLWDDIKQLPPLPRFVSQTIAGVFVAMTLVLSNNNGNPTGSTPLDILISVIWVVGICNSINFFDNIDGGAAGTTTISALALTLIAINTDQTLISSLSLVLAGSTLGFLIWNKSPSRIYMGDAGSLFIGVLLATLSIRLHPNTDSIVASFSVPILLLAIPILDTSVAVISRLLRSISPFQGGKDHLSHRLIRSGINRKRAVLFLWSLSAFFSVFAYLVNVASSEIESQIILVATVIWILLFFYFLSKPNE
jgi:UDP-GlcNAc:undecaprenyl-phosphate GlcNAc-1-phosphate transferase